MAASRAVSADAVNPNAAPAVSPVLMAVPWAGWRVEDLHRVSGRSVPSRFHCARVAAAWAEAGAAITVDEYVAIYGEAQVAHLSLPRKETVDAVRVFPVTSHER